MNDGRELGREETRAVERRVLEPMPDEDLDRLLDEGVEIVAGVPRSSILGRRPATPPAGR